MRRRWCLGGAIASLTIWPMLAAPAIARYAACPRTVAPLTERLLRDLPAYINRAYVRKLADFPTEGLYAIITSQPELQPLPTGSPEYPSPTDPNLHQLFFTVLERHYSATGVTLFQHYHWVFLSQTDDGWQLAFMFSRLGDYPANPEALLTPPTESSQGLTASALRTWLRDCNAGATQP